ncbi:Tn3 family transposase [Pseudofrankia asymbiotica]|uniref:Tn3 transposase DDE domain-containing protein n=1 Tax=Pseudofrankia asymbiotica TaxID=1834516 RepID=A0A1V2IK59_9ACTN|nr:Tn3 family transposase [Pseudofrankia asymbiotica]ONH32836.1 hypothetical protein BL253_03700 [Pseudofrankia asymbiotica]
MEIGRLDRSAYLSTYFADELLRRRVNTQLNRQESRHNLARKIFHGQKGELRQSYREGQEGGPPRYGRKGQRADVAR